MRAELYRITLMCLCSFLVISLAGCGGSSSSTETITVDFSNVAGGVDVALQIDTGAFTPAALQNNKLIFTVPSKTTNFAVAYWCGNGEPPGGTHYVQFVVEATPQDFKSYAPNDTCNGAGGPPLQINQAPVPWSYSGPTPAAFPTFDFETYSTFNGGSISEEATLEWSVTTQILPQLSSTTTYLLDVTAMPSYLNGKTAPITIPDLSAVNALIGAANSGNTVNWIATITGPNSGTAVQTSGSYVEP